VTAVAVQTAPLALKRGKKLGETTYNVYLDILTIEAGMERCMKAPAQETLTLQRPLPDGTLKIVATGEKEDPVFRSQHWLQCVKHSPLRSGFQISG
jgi:hypothetical protein